jgi:hypothetical protein
MALEVGSLIYLEKDRLFFYNGEKVFKLDFTPQIVRDLEILNEDGLISLVFQFIDNIKATPSRFLIVLSESVLFFSDTKERDLAKIEAEFQSFIDLVPFDNVLSKKYQVEGVIKMLATNADLINAISDSFGQRGFVNDGVVPAMVFGQYGVKRGLDSETANYMLRSQQFARGKAMGKMFSQPKRKSVFKVTTGKSTMLPYLIGGFAIVLVGLLTLIFLRR